MMSWQHKAAASLAALAISASGIVLIKHHEGRPAAGYRDPVGIVTACYGHTATAVLGKRYSDAECEALLRADLKKTEAAVKRLVKVTITQDQYDALVSLVFNVGEGAFANSTLLRRLNAGQCLAAADEFLRWNKAKGTVLPGLTKRRKAERELFVKACYVPPKTSHPCAFSYSPQPPRDLPSGRHSPNTTLRSRELVVSV